MCRCVRVGVCVGVCDSTGQSHSSLLLISSLCSPTPRLLHPPANSLLPSLFLAATGRSVRKNETEFFFFKEIGATEESQSAVYLEVARREQRDKLFLRTERGKGRLKFHLISSQLMSFWRSACFFDLLLPY